MMTLLAIAIMSVPFLLVPLINRITSSPRCPCPPPTSDRAAQSPLSASSGGERVPFRRSPSRSGRFEEISPCESGPIHTFPRSQHHSMM